MYAIIESGGKQYRVELGSVLEVDSLPVQAGDDVVLDRVLLVADGDSTAVGRPLVPGAEVRASVVRQDRGDKIIVFKYRPKARRRVKRGHRQELTVLRVADIVHDGRSAAKAAAAEAKESQAERDRAAAEAAEQAARDAVLAARLAERVEQAGQAAAEPKKATPKATRRKAVPAAKAEPAAKAPAKAETKATDAAKTEARPTAPAKGTTRVTTRAAKPKAARTTDATPKGDTKTRATRARKGD